jgi:hypothetical protein
VAGAGGGQPLHPEPAPIWVHRMFVFSVVCRVLTRVHLKLGQVRSGCVVSWRENEVKRGAQRFACGALPAWDDDGAAGDEQHPSAAAAPRLATTGAKRKAAGLVVGQPCGVRAHVHVVRSGC